MADVFISYSSEDHTFAKVVAEALEIEGFEVWWDRHLVPGVEYDMEIERQLREAKCVVVLWSEESVKSRWVRSEASEAHERNSLLPVRIDNVRLPIQFNLIHTESLVGWRGDGDADSWRRIVFRVSALAIPDGPSANSEDHLAASSTATPPDDKKEGLRFPFDNALPAAALTSLVALLAAWLFSPVSAAGPFAISLGLATLAFLLFRLAENDLSPQMKALVKRWLLPARNEFKVRTAEAFGYLFEAAFGRRHFTAFCLARSFVASMVFFVVFLLIAVYIYGTTVTHTPSSIIGLILFGSMTNLAGDYFSLMETRILLKKYNDGTSLFFILFVDLIATVFIFLLSVMAALLLIYGINFIKQGVLLTEVPALLARVWGDFKTLVNQPLNDVFQQEIAVELPQADKVLVYCAFLTTFITSVWFWLALILGPLIRLMAWAKTGTLTVIGFVFDVEKSPVTALAYLSSFIILLSGTAVWGVGEAIAALGLG